MTSSERDQPGSSASARDFEAAAPLNVSSAGHRRGLQPDSTDRAGTVVGNRAPPQAGTLTMTFSAGQAGQGLHDLER
jgi:hypothetical protein